MNLYSDFWKRTIKTVINGIKPTVPIEFDIPVNELKAIGERNVSGYNGKLVIWTGRVDVYTDSAVFRSLRDHLESLKQLGNTIPGELVLKIYSNSTLKVTYTPISYELLIDRYKKISTERKQKEIYKWNLIKRFQDGWNGYTSGSASFSDFFKTIDFRNLLFHNSAGVLKDTVKAKPDELKKILLELYDKKVSLKDRIRFYLENIEKLYFSLPVHGKNTFQDERTIATLLTFRYPDIYTFFKDSFYNKLCKGLGVKPAPTGEKIFHYYSLIKDFIEHHLVNHPDIINDKNSLLDPSCYPDQSNLILAQDILYITLDSSDDADVYDEESETTNHTETNKISNLMFPLNQILFGPPGTGKTYNTINKSLEIIGEKIQDKSRQEIKKLFDSKMKEGQIIFTTFHQSMSYEDFIEGIKPVEPKVDGEAVNYKIIDGIFKRACAIAAYNSYKLYNKSKSQPGKYSFDDLYEAFTESIQEQIDKQTPPVYKSLRGKDVEVKGINSNDSIIARAKNSIAKGSAPLTKENLQKLYDKFKTINEIDDLKQVQETVQVTPRITEFYAVFSGLKEFEKSYKPDVELIIESNEIAALDFEEIQKKFNAGVYNEAIKNFGLKADRVVLIIDEINRGNVSQIFGELITLVEEDKRLGKEEALEAVLPYSKKIFGVPPNLYIIGTMNTADRSVEALDAALRRRFSFEEIRPESTLIYENLVRVYAEKFLEMFDLGWEDEPWVAFEKQFTSLMQDSGLYDSITAAELQDIIYEGNEDIHTELIQLFRKYNLRFITISILDKINRRIEKLLDKDHQIGHSYFMSVWSLVDLKLAFQIKIIPLLQEYFFGDYGKIGLVLGEGFFEPVIINQSTDYFSKFYDYSGEEFEEKPIYKFRDLVKLSNDDFTKAINLLLL